MIDCLTQKKHLVQVFKAQGTCRRAFLFSTDYLSTTNNQSIESVISRSFKIVQQLFITD